MLKIKTILIMIIAIFCIMGVNAHSMEVLVGPKMWYAYWRPFLADSGQTAADKYFGMQNVKLGGGWMYGASAAVRVTNDVSVSVSYLYGILGSDFEVEDTGEIENETIQFRQQGHADIYRHDVDLAASYSLTNIFKIFIGYKYQPIKLDVKSSGAEYNYTTLQSSYNTLSMEMDSKNHCPAAGFGIALPFQDMFVFNTNISALYLNGSYDYKHTRKYYNDADISLTPSDIQKVSGTMDVYGWGYSIEPSVVAVLKENILFAIGFRYQMILTKGEWESSDGYKVKYSGMKDHVFGLYLNAMYRFN